MVSDDEKEIAVYLPFSTDRCHTYCDMVVHRRYPQPDILYFSQPGESEPRMLKNGETVEADEGLIVRNQVPFVPLEEVVVQLGGAYESVTDAAGQTTGAVFSLPWPSAPNKRHTAQIWLGRTDFQRDDEPVPNEWGGYGWGGYMHSQPEERTPFLENGTVYVPLHYLQLSGGSTVLWDSDRRRAIITAAYNEGGISTIPLRRTFFKLNRLCEPVFPAGNLRQAMMRKYTMGMGIFCCMSVKIPLIFSPYSGRCAVSHC